MSLATLSLLRNIGQFDSVNDGAQLPLKKLAVIYAENGRGKTTLAAIMRSLSNGDPKPISERRRLGSQHPPHIVLGVAGTPIVFQNGSWPAGRPDIAVFDDTFVAENVCSGIDIEATHRQNLHGLILGANGVMLSNTFQQHVSRIEEHNRALRSKADAIPAAARGTLTVEQFCDLQNIENVDAAIKETERSLAAARSTRAVREEREFLPFELPPFDTIGIRTLLARELPDIEGSAVSAVQRHISDLGGGGESWIEDGMTRIYSRDSQSCPFCDQSLQGSALLNHYRAYFSRAYGDFKNAINEVKTRTETAHGEQILAAFERTVRVWVQKHEFWSRYAEIPEVDLDTAAVVRTWLMARDGVINALALKQASPLEVVRLPNAVSAAIEEYEACRMRVAQLSSTLQGSNSRIQIVKEQAAASNATTLTSDLQRLKAIQARHGAAIARLCGSFLDEIEAKARTETARDQARTALDQYRDTVFPAYESSINEYLRRFNAGFRLSSVTSVNNRGGSACSYSVLINDVPVTLTSEAGPSFRNTLSAGDRNTLALAFFFASLERDTNLANKVVVIDDPMTSLDEHRSLKTVQEMRRLLSRVSQMIVLSHSKAFLCALWEGTDVTLRSSLRIIRDGNGSTFSQWDVNRDCITEHDHRHALVSSYLRSANPDKERDVAAALRPILECFVRVVCPHEFPPGSLLGPFAEKSRQRHGLSNQIFGSASTQELKDLLEYANKFHHDTNAAWETEAINDAELTDFARRTLKFTSKT